MRAVRYPRKLTLPFILNTFLSAFKMEKEDCVKKLGELFQDYCFESGKAPYYILALLPSETDIIICYKFIKTEPSLGETNYNTTSSVEEITGQPLAAPYGGNSTLNLSVSLFPCEELDDSMKHHGPINIIDARRIINTCVVKLKPNCPVWVLTKSDEQLLLSTCKKDGWVRRCLAFLYNPNNEPTVDDYMSIHKSKSLHLNTAVQASFTCSQVLLKERSIYSKLNYVNIILTLNWTELTISPPISKAKATVEISCNVGHGSSPLMAIWRQILLLQDYLEIIKKHKQESMLRVDLPKNDDIWDSFELVSANRNIDFKKRITEIVQEPGRVHKINLEDKTNIKNVVESLSAPWRHGRELVDNIWILFIGSSNTQELLDHFKQLFIEVDNSIRQMDNRFYHSMNNISRLALVLEGVGLSTLNLNPLEDLVELGIDKLRKEIISIFSYLEITTTSSLNMPLVPKFSEIRRDDWLCTVETWLTWLGRIFTVLEMLSNLQDVNLFKKETFLNVVSTLLSELTGPNSTIESLESLINNPERSVKLPIRTSELKTDFLKKTFDEWKLTLTSKKQVSEVTSVFYRSAIHIFPTSVVGDIDKTKEVADTTICSPAPAFNYIKLHSFSDKFSN